MQVVAAVFADTHLHMLSRPVRVASSAPSVVALYSLSDGRTPAGNRG
jgi:hypothetical protein